MLRFRSFSLPAVRLQGRFCNILSSGVRGSRREMLSAVSPTSYSLLQSIRSPSSLSATHGPNNKV